MEDEEFDAFGEEERNVLNSPEVLRMRRANVRERREKERAR